MNNKIREFSFADVPVSKEAPPIFFAEVGSYFNGDDEKAMDLFKQIVEVRDANQNAPVVLKTEILDNPDICLPTDLMETYQSKDGQIKTENYRELLERKAMPLEKYEPLFGYCQEMKIPTVVSCYDYKAADFSKSMGAAGIKIASANVVHIPLIYHVAKLGLPMVIDSGRASLQEVARAVEAAREGGCKDILLQHSPDGHPAKPEAHNLKILPAYEKAFGLPTGLSDHYVGVEMLYMAIALGTCVLEKGLYFDPNELDQDISHSMDIKDFPTVLQKTYECWQAMGDTWRDRSKPLTGNVGSSQRQGLVTRKALNPGDKLTSENVRFAYPAFGVPVEHWNIVKDWVIRNEMPANQPIGWKDVEAND